MKFENQVALITGSIHEIGRAIALKLANEGAKIILAGTKKNNDELIFLIEEVEKIGSQGICIQCDVFNEEEVQSMITKAISIFGKIDLVVNNVGIVEKSPLLEKNSLEWRKTLDVNLMASVFVCEHIGKYFKKKNIKGSIVNLSFHFQNNTLKEENNGNFNFRCGTNNHSKSQNSNDIYDTTISMLTKSLAIELAPLVRVNAIAPGFIDTDLSHKMSDEGFKAESQKNYLKRCGKPEEIATVVSFLLSDDASFITGELIKVDGGYGR